MIIKAPYICHLSSSMHGTGTGIGYLKHCTTGTGIGYCTTGKQPWYLFCSSEMSDHNSPVLRESGKGELLARVSQNFVMYRYMFTE